MMFIEGCSSALLMSLYKCMYNYSNIQYEVQILLEVLKFKTKYAEFIHQPHFRVSKCKLPQGNRSFVKNCQEIL